MSIQDDMEQRALKDRLVRLVKLVQLGRMVKLDPQVLAVHQEEMGFLVLLDQWVNPVYKAYREFLERLVLED